MGDPPNRLHPVAWMGSLISWLKDKSPQHSPFAQLALRRLDFPGWVCIVRGCRLPCWKSSWELCPSLFRELGEAAVLKSTIGLRGLDQAAAQVESALEAEDLPRARRSVRYHLVSRDTDQLHSGQVAAAAIQSVAENASDGALAPMFFYQLGGLPAALAYRFANTADAMLGYRDPAREWLGKIPARLDDLLNLAPARLSGILIALASLTQGTDVRNALKTMLRDARKTASPNAGYPMSAMAEPWTLNWKRSDTTVSMLEAARLMLRILKLPEAVDLGRGRMRPSF